MQWDGNEWILEATEQDSDVNPYDYVITGIPRSGTSLLSAILSKSPNSICFNEIQYKVPLLPSFFNEMRARLESGKFVMNKTDVSGNQTTDTRRRDGVAVSELNIKKFAARIGSKVNIPYLDNIKKIIPNYKVIAVIRNPIFTIASWNSKEVGSIPEARVTDDTLPNRWKKFSFTNQNKLERQIIIWDYYAKIINDLPDNCMLVKYESLISDPANTIYSICDYLNIEYPLEIPVLISGNDKNKYPKIGDISDNVNELSTMYELFGYS